MKVYNLACKQDHRFEGWFKSEEDCQAQLAGRSIECPMCESSELRRLPSAPRLNLSDTVQGKGDAVAMAQAKILEVLRQVVANTEDVGVRFAEEARRIHYKETDERAIRGTATLSECAELIDEGIDVMPLQISAALKHPVQ